MPIPPISAVVSVRESSPPDPLSRAPEPGVSSADGQLTLFPMPESGAAPILSAINSAHHSIELSCYLLDAPRVLQALRAAARRGVEVRVMMETATRGGSGFARVAVPLRAAGVKVETTPPRFRNAGAVDHAKFICIDDQRLLLGTGNLVRAGLGGSPKLTDRDFWLSDRRAESVREADALFQADWARRPTDGVSFRTLVVTPDNAEQRLLSLVDGAHRRLWIYDQELTSRRMVDRVIAAKARGVDVRVLVASPQADATEDINAFTIQRLRAAGIPAAEASGPYLHAKVMIADGQAFLGSQNFTAGGLWGNRDLGEILSDPTLVGALAQRFLQDTRQRPARP